MNDSIILVKIIEQEISDDTYTIKSCRNDFITNKMQTDNPGLFCWIKMTRNCLSDIGMQFGNRVSIGINGVD